VAPNPVMLVHAATAPRAARLVLPALPRPAWQATPEWSWRCSAAIVAMYPADPRERPVDLQPVLHAEAGPVSVRHGAPNALRALALATGLIEPAPAVTRAADPIARRSGRQ